MTTPHIHSVQCPFCNEFRRKDRMILHLITHKDDIINTMPLFNKKTYLNNKTPFIIGKTEEGHIPFVLCLHCKKGSMTCSERKDIKGFQERPHKECRESFDLYKEYYTDTPPNKPFVFSSWKTKKPEEKVESKATNSPQPTPTHPAPETKDNQVVISNYVVKMIDKVWKKGVDDDNKWCQGDDDIDDKIGALISMYEDVVEEADYDTDDAELDDAKDYKQRLEAANEHIDAITKENRKLRAKIIELEIGSKPF